MGKNRSTANDTVSQATPRAVQQQPARTDLGNLKGKKILVAYFSRTGENYQVGMIEKGNTHMVAEMIAQETGGTLFEIRPADPYPVGYRDTTRRAQQEKQEKAVLSWPEMYQTGILTILCFWVTPSGGMTRP